MLFSKFDKIAIVFVAVVFLILAVGAYTSGSSSRPWHTLQQVSVGDSSFVSVDSDADGNIDLANRSVNADKVWCNGSYKDVNSCGFGSGGGATTISSSCAPEYDSGWFDVTRGQTYSKLHNLGSTPPKVIVLQSTQTAGIPTTWSDYYGALQYGASWWQDDTNVYVKSGNDYAVYSSSTSPQYNSSSGKYRVLAWKDYNCGGSAVTPPIGGSGCYLEKQIYDVNSTLCNGGYCNFQSNSAPDMDSQVNKMCELLGAKFFASNSSHTTTGMPTSYYYGVDDTWVELSGNVVFDKIECWKEDCNGSGATPVGTTQPLKIKTIELEIRETPKNQPTVVNIISSKNLDATDTLSTIFIEDRYTSDEDVWGGFCDINHGWIAIGCNLRTEDLGVPSDIDTYLQNNGCRTDNDEREDGKAVLGLRCMKIEGSAGSGSTTLPNSCSFVPLTVAGMQTGINSNAWDVSPSDISLALDEDSNTDWGELRFSYGGGTAYSTRYWDLGQIYSGYIYVDANMMSERDDATAEISLAPLAGNDLSITNAMGHYIHTTDYITASSIAGHYEVRTLVFPFVGRYVGFDVRVTRTTGHIKLKSFNIYATPGNRPGLCGSS